jgi:hypothetical protein
MAVVVPEIGCGPVTCTEICCPALGKCASDLEECPIYIMECDGIEDCSEGACCIQATFFGPPETVVCCDDTSTWGPVACHADADCHSSSEHCVPVGPPYPDTLKWCL